MAGEWEFEMGRAPQGVARRGRRIYKGLLVLRSGAPPNKDWHWRVIDYSSLTGKSFCGGQALKMPCFT